MRVLPPPSLLRARRALEGLAGIKLLDDWTWHASVNRWGLHCQLNLVEAPATALVPQATNWYVLVENAYPWGDIKFYPAKDGGLSRTFPHQNFNGLGDEKLLWRTGHLCLDTEVKILGRTGFNEEPYDDDWRLRWRFARALAWLEAAACQKLSSIGDPFELPMFPLSTTLGTVVFHEGAAEWNTWQSCNEKAGLVDLGVYQDGIFFVRALRSFQERELVTPRWGQELKETKKELAQGVWWHLSQVPVIAPWQAPANWGEFREVCRQQNVDLDTLLRRAVRSLRDGARHIALVGFPIPANVGEESCRMYWQALLLPRLARGTDAPNGFRPNELGHWEWDRKEHFRGDQPIDWIETQNWHVTELSSRGRLSESVRNRRVLLIGCGALGSIIAELLARNGVSEFVLVDPDLFEAGNLVRHTLGLESVGFAKATVLAERLRRLGPHIHVEALAGAFPPSKSTADALVQSCSLIMDCSGQDEVLAAMEAFSWQAAKQFCSISMGYQAKRLFCYFSGGAQFSHFAFRELITPWLIRERNEFRASDFPREGLGCWHPVFPARMDDVTLLASTAIKCLEGALGNTDPSLQVYEQVVENGIFCGIRRVLGS